MPEKSPTRRWFHFSLRTMFVLMTLVAVTAFAVEKYWWGPAREFRQLCIERRAELASAFESFRIAKKQGQYSQAYAMTTSKYQKQWKFASFKSFGPPEAVMFRKDVFLAGSTDEGIVVVRPPNKPGVEAGEYNWVRVDGRWLLDESFYYPW